MKKIIILLLIAFSFVAETKAQSITSITPNGETITFPNNSSVRIWVKATVSLPGAYAINFSVDPIGKQKVRGGKNKNYDEAITFWGHPIIEGGELIGYEYEVPLILDKINPGVHDLQVDIYESGFKLIESQTVSFTIQYF